MDLPRYAGRRRAAAGALVAVLLAGCAASTAPTTAAPALTNTYWALLEVDGTAYLEYRGTREPHIVFRGDGARVTGFAGCNSLMGAYEVSGDHLRLGPLALTRMACPGVEATVMESAFVKGLNQTAAYRISGATLELLDVAGAPRVRLEARGALH